VLFLLCSVVAQISEPLGVLRQVMKPHNSARYGERVTGQQTP
jgi:hypothetical protein